MISLWVRSLHFKTGEVEELGPSDVLVFVGPNSSGKSRLLGDISAVVINYDGNHDGLPWLTGLGLIREGGLEDLKEWFEPRSRIIQMGESAGKRVMGHTGGGRQYIFEEVATAWQSRPYPGHGPNRGSSFPDLGRHLVIHLPAADRATFGFDGMSQRDPMQAPVEPIHFLWDFPEDEARFSDLVKKAFGFGVCLNRHQVGSLSLLKGSPLPGDEIVPPLPGVVDRYALMPHVSEEGDGVKSFISILLQAIKGKRSMAIVDEPEAFLHPPQARQIGRLLVDETPQEAQVFMATHSADVLQGVLDGRRDRPVKIVRLSREDGKHQHKMLSAERLETLWRDPIIRYSGLLNGLFHEGIVLCEADNDCRFYSAVLDAYLDTQDLAHDLVFTQLGGKGRFDKAVADMNTFGVRTAVIGDIDVLRESTKVKQLVTAAGGDFEVIKHDLIVLSNNVKSLSGAALSGPFQDAARAMMNRSPGEAITAAEKAAVVKSLKGVAGGWDQAKRAGVSALTEGGPAAADRILTYLRLHGIFLVPVGELERWFPLVETDKGAPYVNEVLEQGLHLKPSEPLRQFMEQLVAFFRIGESTP